MVEYRGYGNSQGEPSEQGFQYDALAALDYLTARVENGEIDGTKIFLFGRSLGGAVSIWLASQRQMEFAGMILENTFTSVADMALVILRQFLPVDELSPKSLMLVHLFLNFFMTSHWRSKDSIRSLTLPTLFISGQEDELVPPLQMLKLYTEMPDVGTKQIYKVTNGTHNETFRVEPEIYYPKLAYFVKNPPRQRFQA